MIKQQWFSSNLKDTLLSIFSLLSLLWTFVLRELNINTVQFNCFTEDYRCSSDKLKEWSCYLLCFVRSLSRGCSRSAVETGFVRAASTTELTRSGGGSLGLGTPRHTWHTLRRNSALTCASRASLPPPLYATHLTLS